MFLYFSLEERMKICLFLYTIYHREEMRANMDSGDYIMLICIIFHFFVPSKCHYILKYHTTVV